VLNDSTYRENARKIQRAIVRTNGLSLAADLVEQALGVSKNVKSNIDTDLVPSEVQRLGDSVSRAQP
jgi:hypothetical protein